MRGEHPGLGVKEFPWESVEIPGSAPGKDASCHL